MQRSPISVTLRIHIRASGQVLFNGFDVSVFCDLVNLNFQWFWLPKKTTKSSAEIKITRPSVNRVPTAILKLCFIGLRESNGSRHTRHHNYINGVMVSLNRYRKI